MEKVFEELAAKWPSAIIARAEVGKMTGGGISSKSMANYDCLGTGPKDRFMMGRRVCYSLPSFIEWLRMHSKEGG